MSADSTLITGIFTGFQSIILESCPYNVVKLKKVRKKQNYFKFMHASQLISCYKQVLALIHWWDCHKYIIRMDMVFTRGFKFFKVFVHNFAYEAMELHFVRVKNNLDM